MKRVLMKEKKQPVKNELLKPEQLRNLEQEDQMHDDHGLVIIGHRDRKPVLPPEEKEEK